MSTLSTFEGGSGQLADNDANTKRGSDQVIFLLVYMWYTAEGDISIREESSPGIRATAGAREGGGGGEGEEGYVVDGGVRGEGGGCHLG